MKEVDKHRLMKFNLGRKKFGGCASNMGGARVKWRVRSITTPIERILIPHLHHAKGGGDY
jgi:hypothetical protein